ncbi:MAG: hypothetical protein IJR13_07750 [Bacteroidales bacterium]|nr:hypothetical protein [Bacteroidales bacterium]
MKADEKNKPAAKRPKTGGRQKGTPNRTTATTKEVIATLLDQYSKSGSMADDFAALEPKERLIVAEKLMNYIMPKMQSQQIDLQAEDTRITIENRLRQLSGED